jgi:hypothetical protein
MPSASALTLTWHPLLSDDDASTWDGLWQALDLHPLQHRVLAAARARAYDQGLLFALGHADGELVFGAAVQVRRSGPWPPRFAVQRGPWALNADWLVAGISQMALTPPPGRRPMTLRIDPHVAQPCEPLETRLADLGFVTVPPELHQQTIVCDLTPSAVERRKGCRTLTRRMLKKAGTLGLKTGLGGNADIPAYLAMHRRAAGEKGYGVPDEAWLETLIDSGIGWLVLTRQDDRLVGGGLFALGANTVHYLYGATDPDFDGPALYDTFEWVMDQGAEAGCSRFDFGGLPSMEDGIAFFKRGWGGDEKAFSAEQMRVLRMIAERSWRLLRH